MTDQVRIIHQIWWQGSDQVPEKYAAYRATWRDLHPSWKILTWSEKRIRNLIRAQFPEWMSFFDSLPLMIQKIDVAKSFILFQHGGVYADMDSQCVRALDSGPLMTIIGGLEDILVSRMRNNALEIALFGVMCGWENRHLINNGIIISKRSHHPFWLFYLTRLRDTVDLAPTTFGSSLWVMKTTGPFKWTELIHAYNRLHPGTIGVLPNHYLEPILGLEDPEVNRKIVASEPLVYTIHDHNISWARTNLGSTKTETQTTVDKCTVKLAEFYYSTVRHYWPAMVAAAVAVTYGCQRLL